MKSFKFINTFLKQFASLTQQPIQDGNILKYQSNTLKREVKIGFHFPPNYDQTATQKYPLLLINDGQDFETMKLGQTLERLYQTKSITPIVAAAIHCGDRMQEYGTAKMPDFAKRGSKAHHYTHFITKELMPYLLKNHAIDPDFCVMAGCSLGGLSAMDLVWHNPHIFQKAGVFSGSFWWRKRDVGHGYTDNDRIMQGIVREHQLKYKPNIKIWLQVGTHDETADRNNNGIIDAIEDTLDLVDELLKKGFKKDHDVVYLEIQGGKHNLETWAAVYPDFLKWAFGK